MQITHECRRISGGCLIDRARKLGAARAVIGESIVSGSSLSLKVLKMQSYKYSFSKSDLDPQRQANGHFRGLARFPLLKQEGNS